MKMQSKVYKGSKWFYLGHYNLHFYLTPYLFVSYRQISLKDISEVSSNSSPGKQKEHLCALNGHTEQNPTCFEFSITPNSHSSYTPNVFPSLFKGDKTKAKQMTVQAVSQGPILLHAHCSLIGTMRSTPTSTRKRSTEGSRPPASQKWSAGNHTAPWHLSFKANCKVVEDKVQWHMNLGFESSAATSWLLWLCASSPAIRFLLTEP